MQNVENEDSKRRYNPFKKLFEVEKRRKGSWKGMYSFLIYTMRIFIFI